MKALLHGYFGYGNVGDEAICDSLIEELKREYNSEVVILSMNPDRSRKLHNVPCIRRRLFSAKFIKQILISHVMIFAGGGRYGDSTIRDMCLRALLAKTLGKKVEFRALGIYPYKWNAYPVVMTNPNPFRSLFTRVLLILTTKVANRVSVRDNFSKEVLKLSGVKGTIEVEEDLAFKLKPASPQDSLNILTQHGIDAAHKPLIGVNLRTLHPEVRKRIVNVMSGLLDWLIKSYDANIVFVPFGYGSIHKRFFDDDLIVAGELRDCIEKSRYIKIIDKEYKPQDILGIIQFFDLFIGMRFHSIIFSIMMKVPTVAIVYDTKTTELLTRSKIRCISLTINELTDDKLKEATMALLGNHLTRIRVT